MLTSNTKIRVPIAADDNVFPSFSGVGYAIFPPYKVLSSLLLGAFVVVVWALGRMGREKKERFSSLFPPITSHRSLRRGSASF